MATRKKASEISAASPAGKAAAMAEAASAGNGAGTAGKEAEPAENGGSLFSAEQLLCGERFRNRRDLLTALLEPGRQYTLRSVEEMINNYMKGQVK